MKSNEQLQTDVQEAIKWEPSMLAAQIGVTAKNGVVTLSGVVDSYSKKINAENATKSVKGVKAVAQDIVIDYGSTFKKNDSDIANDIIKAWKYNWEVPDNEIQVKVEDGWVQLDGSVEWKFQEEASISSIENLYGVKGVTNMIKVKSNSKNLIEKKDVENALFRNWSINANEVKVEVNNNNVKLTGLVHSLYQKDEAERLAWNARGVNSVENKLAIIH